MKKYPVIEFWFDEIDEAMWWEGDAQFDHLLKEKFLSLHQAAVRGELYADRVDALGSVDVSNSRLLEPHFLSSKAS